MNKEKLLTREIPEEISEKDEPMQNRNDSTSSCFACGTGNPRGLHLQFVLNEDQRMVAKWTPDCDLEGYHGIVHGGIVSTVLDEAMAKVVAAIEGKALTAEIRVRFRRQVPSGEVTHIRGWIDSRNKKLINAEADLIAQDGTELAHAWGVFLRPR
jgi:acyl-coenzyme A thioesterase PaaI-like protein